MGVLACFVLLSQSAWNYVICDKQKFIFQSSGGWEVQY
jgi:hypothetical protein